VADAPGIALAFAAGFVSFVSPCCLPLVPGYLAAVGGPAPGERRIDRQVLVRSLAFVGTFSAIFIFLGLTATALGALLFDNRIALNTIAGALIVVMGLLFIGSVAVVRLNREWRPHWLVARAGRSGPVVAGASFAVAWTPCVGPTLGAVLGLASTQTTVGQGALLLAVYSAGLAIPFLLSSLAYGAGTQRFSWLRRRYPLLQVASGLVLVAMGGLVLSGELFRLNIEVQQALDGLGLNIWQSL
jgi:cytochrome c-type biogenesis protein